MNKLFGSLALSLIAPAAIAQCALVGSGTSYGGGDDFVANAGAGIDIGFAFPVGATSFQFIHPSSNGFLHLSDGTVPINNSDLSPSEAELAANEARVAVLWDDLNLVVANGGELWVDTSNAPLSCTITWMDAILFGQAIPFSMSCTLNASGQIDYLYGPNAYQITDTIVGVSPGAGALSPGSFDLSSALPSADDMTFELFPANTFDLAGQLLTLIPTLPGYVPLVSVPAGCAAKETYGNGCIDLKDAAFEIFAAGTQDIGLTGTTITFLRGATDYTILDAIPGTYVAPTAGALVVSAADDAFGAVPLSTPMPTSQGTTSTLNVHTNGFVVLSANAPTIAASWTPTAAKIDAFVDPTICGPWYDWSPNVGGRVVYEEVAGIMYVTYEAVTPFGQPTTDTFQYQFDLGTGTCTIVYESMSYGGVSVWHTPTFGYTNGIVTNSVEVDMSDALAAALVLSDVGAAPLSIDSNVPQLGSNWDITTTNVDPVSPITIVFFGDVPPASALPLSFIGLNAPGCDINLNSILADVLVPVVSGSATTSVPIPATPSLIGGVLTAQSICLTLANPANLLTSNGVMGTVGN